MNAQTLLHNILLLSYADRQFIAEQIMLSLEHGKQTELADNTQNCKELATAKDWQRTYTIEESFDECCEILTNHYGVDVKTLL